jgi:hypothetical protein
MNRFRYGDVLHDAITMRLIESTVIITNSNTGISTMLSTGISVAELECEMSVSEPK